MHSGLLLITRPGQEEGAQYFVSQFDGDVRIYLIE